MKPTSQDDDPDFCIYCGARNPPLMGEGTCQRCPSVANAQAQNSKVTTDLFLHVDIRLGPDHLIVQADQQFLTGLTLMHGYTMARYRGGMLSKLHDGKVTPAHLWQKPGQWVTYMDWTGKEIMA